MEEDLPAANGHRDITAESWAASRDRCDKLHMIHMTISHLSKRADIEEVECRLLNSVCIYLIYTKE